MSVAVPPFFVNVYPPAAFVFLDTQIFTKHYLLLCLAPTDLTQQKISSLVFIIIMFY